MFSHFHLSQGEAHLHFQPHIMESTAFLQPLSIFLAFWQFWPGRDTDNFFVLNSGALNLITCWSSVNGVEAELLSLHINRSISVIKKTSWPHDGVVCHYASYINKNGTGWAKRRCSNIKLQTSGEPGTCPGKTTVGNWKSNTFIRTSDSSCYSGLFW